MNGRAQPLQVLLTGAVNFVWRDLVRSILFALVLLIVGVSRIGWGAVDWQRVIPALPGFVACILLLRGALFALLLARGKLGSDIGGSYRRFVRMTRFWLPEKFPMKRADRASKTLFATREAVYAALTDGAARAQWLAPTGMTSRLEHFDARPGGGYRAVLTYDDPAYTDGKTSAGSDVVDVRFVELVPGRKVVEACDFQSDDPAFAGTMTIVWTLHDANRATRVDVEARDVPPGIDPRDHEEGLMSSLDNLAAFVET